MAIIRRQNQDLLNQDQGQPGQDTVVATSTQSAQTPQSQPGQGSPAGGQVQKGPSSSGRFANIQNFIKANKSGQIGQQVGQKVGAEADKAKGVLAQTAGDFSAQAGQARSAIESSRNQVAGAIQNLSNNQNQDSAIKNLSGALQAEYKGPVNLGNEAQLASQGQNLQAIGEAGKTEGGRFALLQKFFGRDRPTYSSGQTRLDNLLLGRQSDVLGKIAGQGRAFGGEVRAEQEKAQATARQAESLAADTRKLAADEGSKAFTTLETGLQAEAQKKATDEINRIRDQVARSGTLQQLGLSGDASLEQMESLGLVSVPESLKNIAKGQGTIAQVSGVNQQTAGTLGQLSGLLGLGKAYDAGAAGLDQGSTTSAFSSIPAQIQSFTQQAISNPEFYSDAQIQQSAQNVLDQGGAVRRNLGMSNKDFESWKQAASSVLSSGITSYNDFVAKMRDAHPRGATPLANNPGAVNQFIGIRDNKAKKFASDSIRRQFGLPVAQGADQAPAANQAPTPVVEGGGFGRTQMIPV